MLPVAITEKKSPKFIREVIWEQSAGIIIDNLTAFDFGRAQSTSPYILHSCTTYFQPELLLHRYLHTTSSKPNLDFHHLSPTWISLKSPGPRCGKWWWTCQCQVDPARDSSKAESFFKPSNTWRKRRVVKNISMIINLVLNPRDIRDILKKRVWFQRVETYDSYCPRLNLWQTNKAC